MLKRSISVFTAFMLVFSLFTCTFTRNAYAYQNNSYFNNVNVGLVSMSSTALTVTLNGDYTVNGQVYPSGTVFNLGLSGTSIILNGTQQSQLSFSPNNSSNLLTITSGSISNKYMGSFIIKVYNGKLLPINNIDIENYLMGVVGYEMSDNFPLEALKAQAVAARNFALSRIGWEASKGYDFDDTINYQVYKGYNPNLSNTINAVAQTKGQVLLYNDKLVETLYSAWHGGISENSENVWGNYVPYLRSVVDTYESDPWPNGNRTFTNSQVQSALQAKGYLLPTDTFIKLDLSSITKFPSGRVSNINIIYKDSTGLIQTKSVTKDSTRTFLTLPSNLYNVSYDSVNGVYTFSGKGNGHGLGMSQIGARNRAAAGQTYDQILKFYYQNVYLQNLIQKAAIGNLSQNSSSMLIQSSESVNVTATAGNGYGYLYKYVVKNNGNVVLTQDYGTSSSFSYTPTAPGSYTIDAYVKDKYSISDYDDVKTASFTVYGNPVLNSFTLNKAGTLTAQTVTGSVNVQGGSGTYLYKYDIAKDGVIIQTNDYSSNSQFNYTPSASGNYTVTAYVKDAVSSKDFDLKQAQSFTAYNALTNTSFTKDVANVFAGDTVNFSAATAGGSGNGVNYKYVVLLNGQAIYTRDFSPSSSLSYVPSSAGNYEVDVYAVDAISDNSYDTLSKMTFSAIHRPTITSTTIDKNQSFVNDSVTLNTTGSAADVLYKYVISNNGAISFTKDYDTNPVLSYMVTAPGNYSSTVYIKNSLSLKDYDDTKTIQFIVYDYAKLTGFTEDKSQLFSNDTINFTANASNGSGSYLYKFVINKDNQTIQTNDYSTANTLSYVPTAEGIYTVNVYVKDVLSQKVYDDTNNLTFTVLPFAKLSSVQTNKAQYLSGQTISLTSTGTLGSGNYLYKFVISKDGTVLSTINYNSSGNLQYTANNPGTYTITEYMKDALSTNSYDDTSTLTIPVYSTPSMSFTGSKSSSLISSPVNYTITEAGGSGKAQYRFVVIKDNNTIADTGYLSANTYSFTPSLAGSYQVVGYLKDSLSENTYDVQSTLALSVYNPQLSAVTASGYFYEGKPVSFSAGSTGSSPLGISYRYEIYSNSTLVTSTSYTASSAFTFTPAAPAVYTVKVYAKDGLSTNSYDSLKQFNITVNSKPLYLSTLPLSYGMTSNDVTALQYALIKLGYALSTPTGYFGSLTKSAVISFQSSHGLSADGIVGNMTYGALNDALIQNAGTKTLNF